MSSQGLTSHCPKLLNIIICALSVPCDQGNEIEEKIEIKIKLLENEVESLIRSVVGQR